MANKSRSWKVSTSKFTWKYFFFQIVSDFIKISVVGHNLFDEAKMKIIQCGLLFELSLDQFDMQCCQRWKTCWCGEFDGIFDLHQLNMDFWHKELKQAATRVNDTHSVFHKKSKEFLLFSFVPESDSTLLVVIVFL